MAAPDAETQKRVADWFSSIGPVFQELLDAIYAEAPEAVSKVISAGTWTADAGDPPLREVLAGGDVMSMEGMGVGQVEIVPWPLTAAAGTARISIPLYNQGSHDHPAFQTIVTWTTPSGASETRTLETAALAPGGGAELKLEIGDLEEGHYDLRFDINPGGAEIGAPPTDRGTHIDLPMPLHVSSAEEGALLQDDSAWSAARERLTQLLHDPAGAPEYLREGLNWLATLELQADERVDVERAAASVDWIAHMDETGVERSEALVDAVTAIGVAATQAGWNDAEGRGPLILALDRLNNVLPPSARS